MKGLLFMIIGCLEAVLLNGAVIPSLPIVVSVIIIIFNRYFGCKCVLLYLTVTLVVSVCYYI